MKIGKKHIVGLAIAIVLILLYIDDYYSLKLLSYIALFISIPLVLILSLFFGGFIYFGTIYLVCFSKDAIQGKIDVEQNELFFEKKRVTEVYEDRSEEVIKEKLKKQHYRGYFLTVGFLVALFYMDVTVFQYDMFDVLEGLILAGVISWFAILGLSELYYSKHKPK